MNFDALVHAIAAGLSSEIVAAASPQMKPEELRRYIDEQRRLIAGGEE